MTEKFGSNKTTLHALCAYLKKPINWQQSFAALHYPNYRLWFWSQMFSLFGTWMQMTAQGYLVFQLTNSPAYLGYLSFANGIPSWVFMIYAGVMADRMPKRTLLIITQTSMMLLAFLLAALTFTHAVQPWHIMALSFGLGIANAFDAPARQAFTLEMVAREDLTNAIALNGAMFNSATAVGPAIGGLMYAWFGPAWCFAINGLSFIGVITALSLMHLQPQPLRSHLPSTFAALKEGFRYVLAQRTIQMLIVLIAAIGIFGFSFVTLIPAWAVNVLGGDEVTNGILQSARGAGALGGALGIALLGRFRFKGKLLTLGTFIFPVCLLLFANVRSLTLSLLVLLGIGVAFVLMMNLTNALIQMMVLDALRGRIMGIYNFILFGFMPMGGLLVGTSAEYLGLPVTVMLGALISFGIAILAWIFFPRLRALE